MSMLSAWPVCCCDLEGAWGLGRSGWKTAPRPGPPLVLSPLNLPQVCVLLGGARLPGCGLLGAESSRPDGSEALITAPAPAPA